MRFARASAILLPVAQVMWERWQILQSMIFLKRASIDFQKSCVSVITKMSAFEWHRYFTCKDASDPFQRTVPINASRIDIKQRVIFSTNHCQRSSDTSHAVHPPVTLAPAPDSFFTNLECRLDSSQTQFIGIRQNRVVRGVRTPPVTVHQIVTAPPTSTGKRRKSGIWSLCFAQVARNESEEMKLILSRHLCNVQMKIIYLRK